MQEVKKLEDLLPLQKKDVFGSLQKSIRGVTNDSRKVEKGFLYVAIKGLKRDGHDFISEAIKKGALVIVGERVPKKEWLNVTFVRVKDSRKALGEIAGNWYGQPSKKLKVIGVTGTKGKTTTCHLIHHILTASGKKSGMVTSIAAKIGESEVDTGFHVTTPDIITLNKFLSEMVASGCEYGIVEVTSHGVDQGRVSGIDFWLTVLTNIAPEHLDYHKSLTNYKRTKLAFFNSGKVKVKGAKSTKINVFPGRFNNLNAQTALEVAGKLRISEEESLGALRSFKLPKGRMEEVKGAGDFRVFIDFAHTPDSLQAALDYLRSITKGKLIAVFGSAGERDSQKRPKMGKVASKISDVIILTSEDPRTERAEDIMNQIKEGIDQEKARLYEEIDRKKAIEKAIKIAEPGDVVGIFGKGHEKSMNYDGKREVPWSDHEAVRETLGGI